MTKLFQNAGYSFNDIRYEFDMFPFYSEFVEFGCGNTNLISTIHPETRYVCCMYGTNEKERVLVVCMFPPAILSRILCVLSVYFIVVQNVYCGSNVFVTVV
jgi:hypothetical protein